MPRHRLVLIVAGALLAALPALPGDAASTCAARGSSAVVTPKGLTATAPTPGQPAVGSANGADTSALFQLDLSSVKKATAAPVKVVVSWGSAASDFDVVVSDRFGFEYGRGLTHNAAEGVAQEVVVTAPITSCEELKVTLKNTAGNPAEALTVSLSVGDPVAGPSKAKALARKGWTAMGLPDTHAMELALDGDPKTRWSTGSNQTQAGLYSLDLGTAQRVTRVVLDTGPAYAADKPLEYEVQVSDDSVTWRNVAAATGSAVSTSRFPVETTRYLRVHLTQATWPNYWSLAEIDLYDDCFAKKAC